MSARNGEMDLFVLKSSKINDLRKCKNVLLFQGGGWKTNRKTLINLLKPAVMELRKYEKFGTTHYP